MVPGWFHQNYWVYFSSKSFHPLPHFSCQYTGEFVHEFGHFPYVASQEDVSRLIDMEKDLHYNLLGDQNLAAINENLLKHFARGSCAMLKM